MPCAVLSSFPSAMAHVDFEMLKRSCHVLGKHAFY